MAMTRPWLKLFGTRTPERGPDQIGRATAINDNNNDNSVMGNSNYNTNRSILLIILVMIIIGRQVGQTPGSRVADTLEA